MQRSRGLLVAAAAAFLAVAATGGAQTLLMPGTPEVDRLVTLYQNAGRVFPVSSFPISKAELDRWAGALAAAIPGSAAQVEAYRAGILKLDTKNDRIAVTGATSFEYTYRSANVMFDPYPSLSTAQAECLEVMDFRRLFLDELPLGFLQFDFARDDGIELAFALRADREFWLDPFHSTNLPEFGMQEGNPVPLENQFIRRGTLWYDFHPLQIEFGRDAVQMGPVEDSLLLSAEIPYLDELRLRLPLGRLNGDLVLATLRNTAAVEDVALTDANQNFGSTIILLGVHRFEYAFDTVRLAVAGRVIVARDYNAIQLGDLFPVFSWHNGYINPNNMCLNVDASWVPLPGLVLTGQLGFDDINLTTIGEGDSSTPTIPAWILTADYDLQLPMGLSTTIGVEAGYTHYLWGNYTWDSSGSNALARAIYRYALDGGNVILPLTSPYGPGATWVQVSARLLGLPWLDATLDGMWFSRMTDGSGNAVNLVTIPYAASSTIEGAPQIQTWSVGLKLGALPFGFFRLSLEPTLYIQENYAAGTQTVWAEVSMGATLFGTGTATVSRGG